jgi:hypothetical protein
MIELCNSLNRQPRARRADRQRAGNIRGYGHVKEAHEVKAKGQLEAVAGNVAVAGDNEEVGGLVKLNSCRADFLGQLCGFIPGKAPKRCAMLFLNNVVRITTARRNAAGSAMKPGNGYRRCYRKAELTQKSGHAAKHWQQENKISDGQDRPEYHSRRSSAIYVAAAPSTCCRTNYHPATMSAAKARRISAARPEHVFNLSVIATIATGRKITTLTM